MADTGEARTEVRCEEWQGRRHHARLETSSWTAAEHSYGKVVAGVAVVEGGRAILARRQVEVLSARAPGVLRVLRATHTHSHSSTAPASAPDFDALRLPALPTLLGGRRPPEESALVPVPPPALAPAPSPASAPASGPLDDEPSVARLRRQFAGPQECLRSPAIVAGHPGTAVIRKESEEIRIPEGGNDSEDGFYDSCPERESAFRDEPEQLEEWRRASKLRRSLQTPRRHPPASARPADLPDNWGSVSRIRRELESCLGGPQASASVQNRVPSAIAVRPRSPKNLTELTRATVGKQATEIDDGIDAEDVPDREGSDAAGRARPRAFGVEVDGSRGTNSLELRASKLSGAAATRGDDWYARRKSYGFERVHGALRSDEALSNRDDDNIESSTDSGICRSSEIVNSISNCGAAEGIAIFSETAARRETFQEWLSQNKRQSTVSTRKERSPKLPLYDPDLKKTDPCKIIDGGSDLSPDNAPISVPIKYEPKSAFLRRLSEGTDPVSIENDESHKKSIIPRDYADAISLKRHTIAVDGIRGLKELYEPKKFTDLKSCPFSVTSFNNSVIVDPAEDISEKKGKKVEFCKTEVHFAAESGRVNIVETDGKPPSTNNFRRRRRNSGAVPAAIVKAEPPNSLDLPVSPENSTDAMKLNYAVITEIKSTPKEIPEQSDTSDGIAYSGPVNLDDLSESDQPRGILKNKPLKPKPYHLGENGNISETNVWGVKLKPVQNNNETPLWRSSVTLTNHKFENNQDESEAAVSNSSGVNQSKSHKDNYNSKEVKGYSTKINFGRGEPIIETSFQQNKNDENKKIKDNVTKVFPKGSSAIRENKSGKVTTKISIDVIPLKGEIQITDGYSRFFNGLKSTALVNSVSNTLKTNNQMILIEKKGNPNVKTAFRSNLCEFRKLHDGKQHSEDSADEEVCSLMNSRNREYLPWTYAHLPLSHTNCINSQLTSRRDKNESINKNNFISTRKSETSSTDITSDTVMQSQITLQNVKQSSPGAEKVSNKNAKNDNVNTIVDDVDLNPKSSFAETLSTPRSLLPGRGSARKLRDHELCYFGIKTPQKESVNISKGSSLVERPAEQVKKETTKSVSHYINYKIDEKQKVESSVVKDVQVNHQPIYENLHIQNKSNHHDTAPKVKHPGESIIEELTKAADEILLALNGYSDEGSIMNSSDDDELGSHKSGRNFKRSVGLATISETNAWREKSKTSQRKSVQADLTDKKRLTRSVVRQSSKNRTPSNSSVESIARDARIPVAKQRKNIVIDYSIPEKPARRKLSSGDSTKARRVQRANSRDALMQMPGSSSEDLAIHTDLRKKSTRRTKFSETKKADSNHLTPTDTIESSKKSSIRTLTILPEIRHKTAISTMKNVSEKSIHKEKINEKTKLSTKERSRRRDKLLEGTISSITRDNITSQGRSRTAETSLDRECGRTREKTRAKDALIRKDYSHRRDKSNDRDNITDSITVDIDKKKKKYSSIKRSAFNGDLTESITDEQKRHSGHSTGRSKHDKPDI